MDLEPNNAWYHLRYGMVLMDLRQMEKARREFELAQEIDPNIAETYVRMGELKMKEGSTRDAVSLFDKAINLDPEFKETYKLLAEAYEQLGDVEKAVALYRRATKNDPEDADVFFQLGLAELKVFGNRNSLVSFNRAVALAEKRKPFPKWFPEALYRLGAAHAAVGEKSLAIKAFNRYLEVAPEKDIDRAEVTGQLSKLTGNVDVGSLGNVIQ